MISVNKAKDSVVGRIVDIAVILNAPIDQTLKDNITDLNNNGTVEVMIRTVIKNFWEKSKTPIIN